MLHLRGKRNSWLLHANHFPRAFMYVVSFGFYKHPGEQYFYFIDEGKDS